MKLLGFDETLLAELEGFELIEQRWLELGGIAGIVGIALEPQMKMIALEPQTKMIALEPMNIVLEPMSRIARLVTKNIALGVAELEWFES